MPKNREAVSGVEPRTAYENQMQRNHIVNSAACVQLQVTQQEARVDSRLIAQQLRNQHKAVMVLVERYADAFRKFGLLPFEMEAVKAAGARGTKHKRFALLNEDQALSFSRCRATQTRWCS